MHEKSSQVRCHLFDCRFFIKYRASLIPTPAKLNDSLHIVKLPIVYGFQLWRNEIDPVGELISLTNGLFEIENYILWDDVGVLHRGKLHLIDI